MDKRRGNRMHGLPMHVEDIDTIISSSWLKQHEVSIGMAKAVSSR